MFNTPLLKRLPEVDPTAAVTVVEAPGTEPGFWAGAPSAVLSDGVFYLAYRTRVPVDRGRGKLTVLARSTDGEHFETIAEFDKTLLGAESLERPAITRTPQGVWQLYVSCATPGSKHWWIEILETDNVDNFTNASRRVVFAGDEQTALKDPVIYWRNNVAHAYLTLHPLEIADEEDRMSTTLATSTDTITWTDHGTVLRPTPNTWDARGARVSAVVDVQHDTSYMLYDGRADKEANCEELLGLARLSADGFESISDEPIVKAPHASGSVRYVSVVPLPDGSTRLYYEMVRADGAHDLVTQLVPA